MEAQITIPEMQFQGTQAFDWQYSGHSRICFIDGAWYHSPARIVLPRRRIRREDDGGDESPKNLISFTCRM